jgi:hypothetical protein
MRKEIFILGLALVGLLIYSMSFEHSAIKCAVTQIHNYKEGEETLLVEFVQPSEVDSVQITEFAYITSCAAGSLEENASWNMDLGKYDQRWFITEDKEEKIFRISGRISGFVTGFPDGCESPSRVEMTTYIYTKEGLKEVTPRAHMDDFKTKIIQ